MELGVWLFSLSHGFTRTTKVYLAAMPKAIVTTTDMYPNENIRVSLLSTNLFR